MSQSGCVRLTEAAGAARSAKYVGIHERAMQLAEVIVIRNQMVLG